MATIDLTPVPPQEAIDYFRRKGFRASFSWKDMWQEEHARDFTVAKAMRMDVLQDIRGAVDKALADGITFETFKKQLTPILQQKGWWGRQSMQDPLTGEIVDAQLGSDRRLRTIFDVNIRTAHAAGQWERIERVKQARPYLRYVAILDDRTRDEHRDWHGTVLPVDDDWWNSHYPPNGWNCRCTVQQLSQDNLDELGMEVSTPPAAPVRPFFNNRTGETVEVPRGVDPGFGYNVGKANLKARAAREFAAKVAGVDAPIGAAAFADGGKDLLDDLNDAWKESLKDTDVRRRSVPEVIGVMTEIEIRALAARGASPVSAEVAVRRSDIDHMQRRPDDRNAMPEAMIEDLPTLLARRRAALWDKQKQNLVYVLDAPGGRQGKFVVEVNYAVKTLDGAKRAVKRLNIGITGKLVPLHNLKDANVYELIDGKL